MKNKLKVLTPILALVLAVGLFAGGTVGAARAALTYYSDNYDLNIEVPCIGVTLEENGRAVAWRDYLSGGRESSGSRALLSNLSSVTPGVYYDEALTVWNSGDVDSYVKVEIRKYWTDSRGNKITGLEPDQIVFDLGTGPNWWIDEDASTVERTVLYYTKPLEPDQRTTALSEDIMMAANVPEQISQRTVKSDENGKTIAVEYAYDGVRMYVEADVYAVQAHNAELSIRSAWGKAVSLSGDGSVTFLPAGVNGATGGASSGANTGDWPVFGNNGYGNGSGSNSNGTNGNGTNGSGTNGTNSNGANGTNGSGTNGSGTNGSNTNGSGTNGSGTNGSGDANTGTSSGPSGSYVLNTRTRVAHLATCRFLPDSYRADVNDTVENLREQGYKSCTTCHPW